MSNNEQSAHGGKRPGAGRKRQFDDLVRRTITLTPEHAAYLEQLGEGNLSAGIRALIEQAQAKQ